MIDITGLWQWGEILYMVDCERDLGEQTVMDVTTRELEERNTRLFLKRVMARGEFNYIHLYIMDTGFVIQEIEDYEYKARVDRGMPVRTGD